MFKVQVCIRLTQGPLQRTGELISRNINHFDGLKVAKLLRDPTCNEDNR